MLKDKKATATLPAMVIIVLIVLLFFFIASIPLFSDSVCGGSFDDTVSPPSNGSVIYP